VRDGWLGYVADIPAGSWRMMVWKGLGGTLNYQTTKGCGICSLRGGGFNNIRAKTIDSVGIA
jgi:hypothetical protein